VFKTTGVDDASLITALALLRGEMNSDIKELKDLVKQALKQNGDPGRQLAGDRYVHDQHAASVDRMGFGLSFTVTSAHSGTSSSRLLRLAQSMVTDELDSREVEQLFAYCTRRNRIGKGSFGTVYKVCASVP